MEVLSLFILFVLYAEIHYKIPGLPNRLFKKEPEMIADMPYRLEKGKGLPVLILVKDAHRYPISLEKVTIRCQQNGTVVKSESPFQSLSLDTPFWWRIMTVELPDSWTGDMEVDVLFETRVDRHIRIFHNDNYHRTGHRPFRVFIDPDPFPGKAGWYGGDLHFHSQYTNDQVEFGAPIPAAVTMARSMGLHFFAVTDHSYDLDDRVGDYLHNDPDIPLWNEMQATISELNRQAGSVVVIPGEELSVGNASHRNVHLLLLNPSSFLQGYGDSAEKWFRVRPQNGIREVIQNSGWNSLAFAAHPEIHLPFLERLLFGRGNWHAQDLRQEGLHGLQILNGKTDASFERGRRTWIDLLIEGKRLSIVAGSDAHGNFGRFRQIRIPFWHLQEDHKALFGRVRTVVFVKNQFNLDSLIAGLKKGCSSVTDGPFIQIEFETSTGEVLRPGDIIASPRGKLSIEALSSPAFGFLHHVDLYTGDTDQKKETRHFIDLQGLKTYTWQTTLSKIHFPERGYLRVEGYSEKREWGYRCLTNPIYIGSEPPVPI